MSEAPLESPASPLTIPVYQILLSLADCDLHGYAILQDIEERTDGEVKLAAGTLYAAVARLMRDGLIEELEEAGGEDADARRRYYRITERGRAAAAADAERMRRFVRMAEDKALLSASSAGKRS